MINEYDLDIEQAINYIQEKHAKRVCLQFPDGLKPFAKEVQDTIQKALPEVELFIWASSCFGACDTPIEIQNIGVELVIQWGHTPWR